MTSSADAYADTFFQPCGHHMRSCGRQKSSSDLRDLIRSTRTGSADVDSPHTDHPLTRRLSARFLKQFLSGDMGNKRQELVSRAKLAERAKRYEDMAASISLVAQSGAELSSEEQDLLIRAYKTISEKRLHSWRTIKQAEDEGESSLSRSLLSVCKELREGVANELREACKDFLDILKEYLLPQSVCTEEGRLSLLKLKCEFLTFLLVVDEATAESPDFVTCRDLHARTSAEMATLDPLNPLRLQHQLNYATLLAENGGDKMAAADMLKAAYDAAFDEMHERGVSAGSNRAHTLIWDIREMLSTLRPEKAQRSSRVEDTMKGTK